MDNTQQRSEEWFAQRMGRFTSSEFYKLMTSPKSKSEILSEGAKTYVMEKVAETLTGQSKPSFDSLAMSWGTENEPQAREWYTKLSGSMVEECGFIQHGEHAGGSPDGLVGTDGGIEIKCPYISSNHVAHLEITDNESMLSTAKDYYWQMQSLMFFSGRKWWDFVSCDPRFPLPAGFHIVRIFADKEHHDLIQSKLKAAIDLKLSIIERISNKTTVLKPQVV